MLACQELGKLCFEEALAFLQSGEKASCHPLHFSKREKGDTPVKSGFTEPKQIFKTVGVNVV